jgi:hypothetical protein
MMKSPWQSSRIEHQPFCDVFAVYNFSFRLQRAVEIIDDPEKNHPEI